MTDDVNDSKDSSPVQRTKRMRFGMVDPDVIRDESLPRNVRTVYTYLVTYCSDVRSAYPSRARIARQTGMSVRTLDAAIQHAEAVGLFTVERRREGNINQTNVYRLHDFGEGYEPGFGGVVQPLHQGVGQSLHEDGATVAPDLYNVSTPSSIQTSTSGDAYAASGHRTSSLTDMKITPSDRYWKMDGPHAMQHLASCVVRTLKRAKLELRPEGRKLLGASLKENLASEGTYEGLIREAESWVTHQERWSQLAYPPRPKSA